MEQTRDRMVVQITDLHIFANLHDEFDGINTYQSLNSVLQLIKTQHPDFDLMIVTGDLVQDPVPAAYENMQKLLSEIRQPFYFLPGNHDDPELMQKLFRDSYTRQINLNEWVIINLNSYKPETHSGYLNTEELKHLSKCLENTRDANVLVCLHHHPVSVHSQWMDSMMLENPEDLFHILDRYDHIKGIVWGHIHQEFSTTRKNTLLLGTPSTCAQFQPHAAKFTIDTMQPGYRWLKLKADGNIETGVERLSGNDIVT